MENILAFSVGEINIQGQKKLHFFFHVSRNSHVWRVEMNKLNEEAI